MSDQFAVSGSVLCVHTVPLLELYASPCANLIATNLLPPLISLFQLPDALIVDPDQLTPSSLVYTLFASLNTTNFPATPLPSE